MAAADDPGGSGEAGLLDGSIGMTPAVGVDARVMVDDSGRSGLLLMLADVVPAGSNETTQQTYYLALRKHWNVHPLLAWNVAGDLTVSGEYSNGAETDVWLTMDVVEFMDSEFNPVGVSNSNYLGSGKTIDAGNREAARKITNVFGGMAFGLLAAPAGAALGGGLLAGAAATGSRLVVAGASVGLSVAGGVGTVTAAVQTAQFVDKFLGSTMYGGPQVTANDAFAMSSMVGGGVAGSAAAGIGSRVARLRPSARRTPTSAKRESGRPPAWLKRLRDGNQFNKNRAGVYEVDELYISREDGGYYRVDSYTPGDEIASRRLTQLAEVREETAFGYLAEFVKKYSPGRQIADVPSTPPTLVGKHLSGDMIFEVPHQTRPVPQPVLDRALALGITIRDVGGHEY